ncbi:MAG: hypothetical protein HYZ48_00055 [Chlamydiales bacterium]|nr:hypothetical protein [Chlamydiales bacterium]
MIVFIDPGPLYELESYTVYLHPPAPFQISLQEIDVELEKPVLTKRILQSELKLLTLLSQKGFPLASIQDRSIIVDGKTKGVRVCLDVATGDLVRFGPSSIVGLEKTKPLFIEQKTLWKEGEIYDSTLVEKTQTALLDSHLFSSVLITHEESVDSSQSVPMKIELSEGKYKSIQAGISYQTVFGPGITFGWENRNVGKMGRLLSFQGDITRISQIPFLFGGARRAALCDSKC